MAPKIEIRMIRWSLNDFTNNYNACQGHYIGGNTLLEALQEAKKRYPTESMKFTVWKQNNAMVASGDVNDRTHMLVDQAIVSLTTGKMTETDMIDYLSAT